MAKPSSKISWTDGNSNPAANVQEPSSAKKIIGWEYLERVPYQFLNWLFKNISDWINYFETRTDSIITAFNENVDTSTDSQLATILKNNNNTRYFKTLALANGASVDLTHDFKTSFSELSYNLYLINTGTGEHTLITDISTPNLSQFSIVAKVGNETTQVTLTNSSGSSRDLVLNIIKDNVKIKEENGTRYFRTLSLANGASVDFTHNFRTSFSELSYNLYLFNTSTGEHTLITESGSPNLSQFTISATPSFTTSRVRVTNNSGSSRNLVLSLEKVCLPTENTKGQLTSLDYIPAQELLENMLSSWTATTGAGDQQWNSVCFGNGIFVAVNQSLAGNRVSTSVDGQTWVSRSTPADNSWNGVCFGNNLFVSVSLSGTANRVMTSSNGITWVSRSTSGLDSDWRSVCFGNGVYVAVASAGTARAMYSPDGISWFASNLTEASFWRSVTYGNGIFVAVASSGTNRIATSPDGINWTLRGTFDTAGWYSVTFGKGIFSMVGTIGTTHSIATSTDGITWTGRGLNTVNFTAVTYARGVFVAVATDPNSIGNSIAISYDAINWRFKKVGIFIGTTSIAYGNGIFLVMSSATPYNKVFLSGSTLVSVTQNFTATTGWGSFTSGTLTLSKVGNVVTLYFFSLAHASNSSPISSTGNIPPFFAPIATSYNVYYCNSVAVYTAQANSDGSFAMTYRDWAGALSAQTSTGSGSVSWILP